MGYQLWVLLAWVGLCVTGARAEPLKIIGFDTMSGLTFEGATVSNFYTIEFALSPSGPWTNWGSLTEQPITGSVMAATAPFFYRIRQTDGSAFPPYAVVGHTHSNIVSSMLAPAAVETATLANAAVTTEKIAKGAVTESKLSASGALVTNLNADLLDGSHAASFLQPGGAVASVKQVVRGTLSLPWNVATGSASFSPLVAPSKCFVSVRAIATSSNISPIAVIVTGLSSNSITVQKCGNYGTGDVIIEFQIMEYN